MRLFSLFHKKKFKTSSKRQVENPSDIRQSKLLTGDDGADQK